MTASFLERGLSMVRNGYRIIPIPGRRKGPVEDGWESFEATEDLVHRWYDGFNRDDGQFVTYRNGNIGVLTSSTPAVDLDILDNEFVAKMVSEVEQIVGDVLPVPARVGRAPKRLLLFCTSEPFSKIDSGFFTSPDGQKHKVEVLGHGQQFVAYGIHPDTGKEFNWLTVEQPVTTPVDELPSITREQAELIVQRFRALARERGWKPVTSAIKGKFDESGTSLGDGGAMDMRPKLRIDADEVREALELMDGAEDYETWVRVGMGLHHQFDGSEEGFALWDQWSQNAPNYDEKALRYRWRESFTQVRDRGHGPITVAFIVKNANDKRRQAEDAAFEELQSAVTTALDLSTLVGPIAKRIGATELSTLQRGVLAKLMQKAVKKFTGVNPSLRDMHNAIRPRDDTDHGAKSGEELEVRLARRVLRTRFEDGANVKRFSKIWWTYQDGVWRREEDEFMERCVLETLTDLRRINDKTLRDLIGQMDESRGDRLNALVSTVTSMMGKLVAEQGSQDPLNLHSFEAPRVINCKNVEVWIEDDGTLRIEDHNPIHCLTSQLACEYDDLAVCPTWDASIRRVFQRCAEPEEVIRHFYEVMGYIMQPTRDQAIWVLLKGPGGNGKSFLLNVISELMGRGSVIGKSIAEIAAGVSSHFTTQLLGKLMLLDDDLKAHTLLPDDWLKKLSEAKLLTADPKFANSFEFVARSIPVILTNPWPATTDLSEGLRRRVQVFESLHILTDDEKDPAHMRTIRGEEMPGVLNHLIAGLQRFLRRGSRFRPPRECLDSKDRWLASSNTTMRFIDECLERIPDRRHAIRASDLYDHYIQWLRFWETSAKPLGRNKFYEAMDACGLRRVAHSNVAHYTYVKFKPLEGGFADLEADGLEA